MFSQANKNIARYVDRGDYFRDSINWYCKKFLSPIPHWAYILVITLFVVYGTYIMALLFMEDLKVKQYPLPIYSIDQVKYFPHIKALSTEKEPINVSVSRYLTSQYVIARENYDFDKLKNEEGAFDRNFINSMSSARIGYEYKASVSEENPQSPIVKYKSFTTREIEVDKVELLGKWDLPEKAFVTFTSIEIPREGDRVISKWQSEISFSMNDLEAKRSEESSPQLRFTVTAYNTKKLS